MLISYSRQMDAFLRGLCPWPLAGLLVGLLAVALQWVDNLPLGATGAAAGFLDWVRRPWTAPSWRVFFFGGIVAGGWLHARVTGAPTVSWRTGALDGLLHGSLAAKLALLAIAGGFIGFGARWAGGCTSGHGICGIGRLQSGSVIATSTFVLTAVIVANILWHGAPL